VRTLDLQRNVALYRLTLEQPARNTQARYNVCPTTTIDTIVRCKSADRRPDN
jgi:hypothetical protein